MKIEEVAKLEPVERFLYWIKERHRIYKKRQAGKSRPWTDDEVLQSIFFTNPYRENDKTTVWFRENVRDDLSGASTVLMATVIFRWFNKIETGEVLADRGLLTKWNEKQAVRALQRLHLKGPVFTGAYMIKAGNGPKGCKIPNVCQAISNVWAQRKRLVQVCLDDCRLQALCEELQKFPHLGGFMSYEIACDLRYTYLLEDASDVDTWCNPGPGAKRGLTRLSGESLVFNSSGALVPPAFYDTQARVRQLLKVARRRLRGMPHFELREVEHSLCEWDKYERARLKNGRIKRIYKGIL